MLRLKKLCTASISWPAQIKPFSENKKTLLKRKILWKKYHYHMTLSSCFLTDQTKVRSLKESSCAILISFKSVVIFADFVFDFSKNGNTFERNEDCPTVFLKRTDFSIFFYFKLLLLQGSFCTYFMLYTVWQACLFSLLG